MVPFDLPVANLLTQHSLKQMLAFRWACFVRRQSAEVYALAKDLYYDVATTNTRDNPQSSG